VVQRGQFLERPALIEAGDFVLDGLSHRGAGRPPLLIIPAPPGEGPGMDDPLCAELAWAAATAGFATLRFNFRGVGASQGTRAGAETDLADSDAALRLLMENAAVASAAVAALGGSVNTALELRKLHPGLSGLCLIQPTEDVAPELPRVAVPLMLVLGDKHSQAPLAALSAAATEAGGRVEVVPRLNPTAGTGLSQVGKTVVRWLESLRG
jgi:alpha/beta superfamily hydrolase